MAGGCAGRYRPGDAAHSCAAVHNRSRVVGTGYADDEDAERAAFADGRSAYDPDIGAARVS